MFLFIILLGILAVATESLTELVVKSEIFQSIRGLIVKIPIFGAAIRCGYCSSVWISIFPTILVLVVGTPLDSYFSKLPFVLFWMPSLFWLLFFHRISNYLHNINDKWFDKYYAKKD